MIITIKVDDDKILEAVIFGMKKEGYRNAVIDDVKYIDPSDIARFIIPSLDINDEDIEIER